MCNGNGTGSKQESTHKAREHAARSHHFTRRIEHELNVERADAVDKQKDAGDHESSAINEGGRTQREERENLRGRALGASLFASLTANALLLIHFLLFLNSNASHGGRLVLLR